MCQNGGDVVFCNFCKCTVCQECLGNFDIMDLSPDSDFECPSCWEKNRGTDIPYHVSI